MLKWCFVFGGAVVFVLNFFGAFRGLDPVTWFILTWFFPFQIAAATYVAVEALRTPYNLLRYRRHRITYPTAFAIGLTLAVITVVPFFFTWPWQYRDRTIIEYPFGIVAPQVYQAIWATGAWACLIGLIIGLPIDYYLRRRTKPNPYQLVS